MSAVGLSEGTLLTEIAHPAILAEIAVAACGGHLATVLATLQSAFVAVRAAPTTGAVRASASLGVNKRERMVLQTAIRLLHIARVTHFARPRVCARITTAGLFVELATSQAVLLLVRTHIAELTRPGRGAVNTSAS